jgi:hypothetical protein
MIEFIYVIFFWLIVLQVGIFAFLNVPSPASWRATLIMFINTNKYIRVFLRYHLWLCIISAFFFYDSYGTERSFLNEIHNIKASSDGSIAVGNLFLIQNSEEVTCLILF